jgi:hypothetical protein
MPVGKSLAFVGLLVWLSALAYFHERAHRYDIVGSAAGGGASSDQKGDVLTDAYLIDHWTGKVWYIDGGNWVAFPISRLTCADIGKPETPFGCKDK